VNLRLLPINKGSRSRGPITERLQKKFFDVVAGKDPKYKKWLDYVK